MRETNLPLVGDSTGVHRRQGRERREPGRFTYKGDHVLSFETQEGFPLGGKGGGHAVHGTRRSRGKLWKFTVCSETREVVRAQQKAKGERPA